MARKTSITDRRMVIPASALESRARPRFFDGRFLTADDLRQEQEYLDSRRRLQNLAILGVGVVTGLAITDDPGGGGICIGAGYAVDGFGREIIVPADACVPWPTPDQRPPRRWGVVIEYAEWPTDPVPTTDGEVASMVSDGYVITVLTEPPAPDDARVVLRPFAGRDRGKARKGS